MATTCLKCDYTRRPEDPPPLTECPTCGAVYSKLEALVASGASIRPAAQTMPPPIEPARATSPPLEPPLPPSPPTPPRPPRPPTSDARMPGSDAFIVQMRRESNYHGFRDLVSLTFWVMTLVALVLGITALVALFTGQLIAGLSAFGGALIVMVVSRAARDGSLMLADLSDAAVRMAERR